METQEVFEEQDKPTMHNLIDLVFRNVSSSVLNEYKKGHEYWGAKKTSEFAKNLSHLMPSVSSASTEEAYLGVNFTLAVLVRNFTSHLMVEDPQLLQGQYVRCVRAILTTTFAAWKAAKKKKWI